MGIRAKKNCFSFSFSLEASTWRIYDAIHASGNGIKNGTCLSFFLFFSAVFTRENQVSSKEHTASTSLAPRASVPSRLFALLTSCHPALFRMCGFVVCGFVALRHAGRHGFVHPVSKRRRRRHARASRCWAVAWPWKSSVSHQRESLD